MKNYHSKGENLTLTAPSGGVTSGEMVKVGSLFGIANSTEVAGSNFVLVTNGVFTLPKRSHASEEAISGGEPLYLDADGSATSGKALSKVSTGNGNIVAIAVEDTATESTEVLAKIRGFSV